ncbi:MAG: GNAT family N-acetyltransferase [Flavobacteriales bacterium]
MIERKWVLKSWSDLNKDELYRLLALRVEVFVIEQDCPYQDLDGKDQVSYHFWCQDEQRKILAYVRIVPPGISYTYPAIGRVVTHEAHRKEGLGIQLMQRSMEETRKLFPNQKIKISAQQYLIKFYQKFGFETTGEGYLEDDIPHIAMITK